MDINNNVGKTYIMPLFTPLNPDPNNYTGGSGQGSKYYYNVVQFVGVTIMSSPSYNGQVWIQPALVSDPNMVLDPNSIIPLGTSTLATTLAAVKLTN
jgi:hypothetical protein